MRKKGSTKWQSNLDHVAANLNPDPPELASRSQRARASNERIARSALRLHFLSRVPFLCECNDRGCTELVLLALDDYDQTRPRAITAPGHDAVEARQDPARGDQRHEDAARTHEHAALRHDQAANWWATRGDTARAGLERRNAQLERAMAALERDRAQLDRSTLPHGIAERTAHGICPDCAVEMRRSGRSR
jgi:hypothetical protein